MALHDFPRCSAYLKAMRFRLDDPAMTDYGWAVALSENWTDEFLVEDGRVNFDTMGGTAILTEFERLLSGGHARRNAKRKALAASGSDMESLKAFVGSRGVKASALKSAEDFWTVAHILWPHAVKKGQSGHISELLGIIRSMSKKGRSISASENIKKVPAQWRAR